MKRNKYRHIFFDLDHTLWDFEKNSDETLSELFDELKLADIGAKSFENFMSHYREQNQYCWTQYRNGKMTKEEVRVKRFLYTFEALEMKRKDLAIVLSDLYVSRSPEKRNLIEGSMELLDHLKEKYALHIITNGFEEVQYKKIKRSGLAPYFEKIITSEAAGALKPSEKIFEFALRRTSASRRESIYIGDNLQADILGARNAGIDQIYFNPSGQEHEEEMTWEVRHLKEIISILP